MRGRSGGDARHSIQKNDTEHILRVTRRARSMCAPQDATPSERRTRDIHTHTVPRDCRDCHTTHTQPRGARKDKGGTLQLKAS